MFAALHDKMGRAVESFLSYGCFCSFHQTAIYFSPGIFPIPIFYFHLEGKFMSFDWRSFWVLMSRIFSVAEKFPHIIKGIGILKFVRCLWGCYECGSIPWSAVTESPLERRLCLRTPGTAFAVVNEFRRILTSTCPEFIEGYSSEEEKHRDYI